MAKAGRGAGPYRPPLDRGITPEVRGDHAQYLGHYRFWFLRWADRTAAPPYSGDVY